MDLPKTFKDKLTPRLRNIVTSRAFEQAEKDQRKVILPKDILLSIMDDDKTFGSHVVKAFDIDIQSFIADIMKESPIYQSPSDSKRHHESFFQLMKVASKISREMQKNQVGSEHIILGFLRYSGKSKHISSFKDILNKYGIEYEKYFEGVISITNHVEDNKESIEEKKKRYNKKENKVSSKNSEATDSSEKKTPQEMEKQLFDTGVLKDLNSFILKKNEKIVGRDEQIQRCVRVLCRKKKSNPIIIGEPGVGKTTLVEGIAQAIVEQSVPQKLANTIIYEVSLGNLIAGTKYRGQFEERMVGVVNFFTSKTDGEKVAFIDEIHHLIKAGSAEGAVDASFILKPKLADGSFRCIGTTTFEEYRKFILSDTALARRFRPVFLEEPSIEQTIEIVTLVKDEYEEFHGIKISNNIIKKCVEMADTYVKDRFFPDKAFDILDEACAQAVLEDHIKEASSEELSIDTISEVISNLTGIPVTTVSGSEKDRLAKLEENIKRDVVGQSHAVVSLCNSIKRSRLGFKDKNKPMGCYLFVGRTGVGKTLLAKKISEYLFGENKLIRLDMSEYMEKHSVSRIIGAPPGYVGYESGGQLTEKIRTKPYSVILFDEIEKAHPEVSNLLLQILDEGRLTDSFGRVADFRNTIIIMTSNLSASKLDKINNKLGFNVSNKVESPEEIEAFLKSEAEKHFPPEFINRLDEIIVFNKFSKNDIYKIFELELEKTVQRLAENGYTIELTKDAKDHVMGEGYDEKYGARPMSRAIARLIEVPLANAYFSGLISEDKIIVVDIKDEKLDFSNK